MQFGVSESTTHNLFHYWSKILRELLPASLLEQIKKNELDWEWVKEILVECSLVVDSSEQVRERPKLYQEQKKFYSGKKKTPRLKNQLIVLPNGAEIVDVTVGKPGRSSDINLFRAQQAEFAANQKFKGDKGYIGEVQIETPQKKPIAQRARVPARQKRELTPEQKEKNKQLSAQRIVIEHVIRLVKIF